MIARRIRNALALARNPLGAAERSPSGSLRALKVALIADELTASCLSFECSVRYLTPLNYRPLLHSWRPDLLFVESAWNGYADSWRHRIAAYPGQDSHGRRALRRVVDLAKSLGIPTVFWCREDGVHFERFIDSARLFEHVFTVDETCVPHYQTAAPEAKTIETLMFAVQPRIHHCEGATYDVARAVFMGTYCTLQHPQRRAWLDLLLHSASAIGVTAFDRNHHRREPEYRFPTLPWLEVQPGVPHARTGDVYRRYKVSLNVNTIEDSATMFSRRLIEILACGSALVTTPAASVDRYFRDYCEVIEDAEQGAELFSRLRSNPLDRHLRERAMAGVACVHGHHTWKHRLEQILDTIGGASSSRHGESWRQAPTSAVTARLERRGVA
ncbi:MAG: glycosyltransferase family 1 protein [Polyangiaceae bacterium]|nr:glycosyltransferase family 1 protein [Polyangiaceae bacterium]